MQDALEAVKEATRTCQELMRLATVTHEELGPPEQWSPVEEAWSQSILAAVSVPHDCHLIITGRSCDLFHRSHDCHVIITRRSCDLLHG